MKPCLENPAVECPGDTGETHVALLGKVVRVPKSDDTVEMFGALDEAAARLEYASAHADQSLARPLRLLALATRLAMGYAASGDYKCLESAHAKVLEAVKRLPRPTGWVFCRGEPCASANLARALVRRAERIAARLGIAELVKLLNRLGDAVFMASAASASAQARRLPCG